MDENTKNEKIQIFIAYTVIVTVVVMVLLVAFGAFDRK
jgi:t-SNARE complex subunit (syntaxin)